MTQRSLHVIAAGIVLAACADAPRGETAWRGSVDTLPGGVQFVQNPEQGVWPPGGEWRLVEELRIGAAVGEGPDVFGEVAAVGVSPAGAIHVIDGHAQEVRVFAPTGEHVRTFGRRGGGPGEFGEAFGLDWDAAGRLWIADVGNNRYAVYDSAATLLFHAPRGVPGVVFPWLGGFGRDGRLYDVAASQGPDGLTRFTFHRVADSGAVESVLPPIEHRRTGPPLASMTLFWLTPRTTFAFDPRGYVWFANTGEYRLVQRTLEGDTVRIVARAHTKTRVTQAERDSIALQLQRAPAEHRNPPIPTERPALERIFVDPAGTLYVRPAGEEGAGSFDVFDEDGRYLGRVQSDVAFVLFPALPRFTRDAVYGVAVDSLGVQYVVRARIAR